MACLFSPVVIFKCLLEIGVRGDLRQGFFALPWLSWDWL